jgi:carboxypeptidase PM20D1
MISKLLIIWAFLTGYLSGAQASIPDSVFRITVNNQMLSAPQVLSLYVQHKSISGHEKYAGEWLKSVCRENGLFISDFGSNDGNYNFAASLLPLENKLPNIVFLNHIDVVDEGDSNLWVHPPFSGYISETEVWGRGSVDNKGAAIMQLFSILEYKSKNDVNSAAFNVTFLPVSCEETICEGGVGYVTDHYLHALNPVVIIGEGAPELSQFIEAEKEELLFGISLAHKRPLWLKLELNISTSSHGSVTPMEYATKEMSVALAKLDRKKTPFIYTKENKSILKAIGDQKSGMVKFVLKRPVFFKPVLSKLLRNKPEIFSLFTNTITITSINSNSKAINEISNQVTANLDCRLLPHYPKEKTIAFIQKALESDKIHIDILKTTDPAPVSDSGNPFYKHLEAAVHACYQNVTVLPIILPNYNDVGKFRSKGIQGFSIIPVRLEVDHLKCIHAENERIPVEALFTGAKVYLKFLEISMHRQ